MFKRFAAASDGAAPSDTSEVLDQRLPTQRSRRNHPAIALPGRGGGMSITTAAKLLGGNTYSRDTVLCPGPGHTHDDRSLSVLFDQNAPDSFIVYSFAGDDWQACRDHVRARLGIRAFDPKRKDERLMREIPQQPTRPITLNPEAACKREYARKLWSEGRPIGGTRIETYLRGRALVLTDEAFTGHALRYHPKCPFRLESGETVFLPAMLAAMVGINDNEFRGIHRTAIVPDGSGKAKVSGLGNPRKMLGDARRACVKLCRDEEVTLGLAIAEGIETALAVMSLGYRPVWAALSAGTMAQFPVLAGIETLSLFVDNDASGTGQRAAEACAARWVAQGRECVVRTPLEIGSDFNDLVAWGKL
ncbi:toprim domain-containing protein [Mesorhizobium sp. KR2-14]|uniref:DUF7146 domain-containing protein n=1 Tax=Mesorhizobium sp. KR2-14 TaxID=3156610 RepID=UPI0032B61D08